MLLLISISPLAKIGVSLFKPVQEEDDGRGICFEEVTNGCHNNVDTSGDNYLNLTVRLNITDNIQLLDLSA